MHAAGVRDIPSTNPVALLLNHPSPLPSRTPRPDPAAPPLVPPSPGPAQHPLLLHSTSSTRNPSPLLLLPHAGFKSTGYHRLLALLNTYCYFNHETQQLVLVLTPSGFTNHAPEGSSRGGGRELQGSGGGAEKQQQGPVANSGFSQDDER